VLAAACGARGRELASAGKRATGGSRHGLGVDDAVLAVRRAAVRLGMRSLTRSRYAEAREQIIAASPAAGRAETAASMPDLNQLDGLLRRAELSWSAPCSSPRCSSRRCCLTSQASTTRGTRWAWR
jgi:hypothetical protein